MKCIYCGENTKTGNSRKSFRGHHIWRRRRCMGCNSVFTTEERPDVSLAVRIKSKSGLEPFLYEKLYLDVYDSLSHRKTAYTDAKALSATIISRLIPCKTGVITTSEVKVVVIEVLKRFDKAAATHYRAHHS